MRHLRILLVFNLLCPFFAGATGNEVFYGESLNAPGEPRPRPDEQAMLKAINRLRMDPSGYRLKVEQAYFDMLRDSTALKQEISETVITRWTMLDEGAVVEHDTLRRSRFSQLCDAYHDLLIDLANAPSVQPLEMSHELLTVAHDHAQSDARDNYLEHQGQDGSLPDDRIRKALPWAQEGNENIAAGPGDADDILLQLMVDSGVDGRGHRQNLLNPDWRYVACLKVDAISSPDLTWWVQEFAR
jgi:uncharacterized protein YkwD